MKKSIQNEPLIVGKHNPALDGLRGIAILLVMWFHTSCYASGQCFSFQPIDDPLTGWEHNYYILSLLGQTGVDLFFVISGFLITAILLDTKENPGRLKNFYIRRSLRIFPLYFFVLFSYLFIYSWLGSSEIELKNVLTHVFYVQNWSLNFPGADFALLGHTWSLAVEEQFYLIWPVLLYALLRLEKKEMIITCCSLIAVSWLSRFYLADIGHEKLAYTSTLSRMDALILGGLVSILRSYNPDILNKNKKILLYTAVTMTGLVIAMIGYYAGQAHVFHHNLIKIGLTAFSILYTALLALTVINSKKSQLIKILSSHKLQKIGQISYGLYLYHVIVMLLLINYFGPEIDSFFIRQLILLIPGSIISLILAYLSFKYFEKPILKLKDKYAPND